MDPRRPRGRRHRPRHPPPRLCRPRDLRRLRHPRRRRRLHHRRRHGRLPRLLVPPHLGHERERRRHLRALGVLSRPERHHRAGRAPEPLRGHQRRLLRGVALQLAERRRGPGLDHAAGRRGGNRRRGRVLRFWRHGRVRLWMQRRHVRRVRGGGHVRVVRDWRVRAMSGGHVQGRRGCRRQVGVPPVPAWYRQRHRGRHPVRREPSRLLHDGRSE
mmetsp:Transcript_11993/g.32426  ORF Transcript_11993/g.32426 Transcript_11993/m.32426 type:complete len:215 (+) Transcript_11993:1337-1981(+)